MSETTSDILADIIRERRTTHELTEELPPESIIHDAIDVARWAPNHHQSEPWHFYLLGQDTKQSIVELNGRLIDEKKGPEAGAKKRKRWAAIPGWLVVTYDRNEDALREKEDYAATCCAIQNLMLYLHSRGISSKWSTGPVIRTPEFYDLIWVDPNCEEVAGLLWYGYAAEEYSGTRKPTGQILTKLP